MCTRETSVQSTSPRLHSEAHLRLDCHTHTVQSVRPRTGQGAWQGVCTATRGADRTGTQLRQQPFQAGLLFPGVKTFGSGARTLSHSPWLHIVNQAPIAQNRRDSLRTSGRPGGLGRCHGDERVSYRVWPCLLGPASRGPASWACLLGPASRGLPPGPASGACLAECTVPVAMPRPQAALPAPGPPVQVPDPRLRDCFPASVCVVPPSASWSSGSLTQGLVWCLLGDWERKKGRP